MEDKPAAARNGENMTLDQLYRTIQGSSHGGSSHGMSMHETAAKCGRKANLNAKHRDKVDDLRQEERDPDEVQALDVGTYFHALQENGLRGQLEDSIWDQTDEAHSIDFVEAVRLWRGYNDAWGSMLKRWGAELIGVEVPLPGDVSEHVALWLEEEFGDKLTGRADAIIRIVDANVAYENTGLLLREGGTYLFDFKSAGQKNAKQDWQFTFGNQAITYCLLYNLLHAANPVDGFVFDLTVRHKTLRKEAELDKNGKLRAGKSFHAFLAQILPGDEEIIKGLVRLSVENRKADKANPSHCFDGFSPCPFFKLGLCDRK